MPQKKKRVVFDIETEPFSESFSNSKSEKERIKNAPRMRLACLYDEGENEYFYFTEKNVDTLIKRLIESDEVVSFNGTNFDLLVLKRHYKLTNQVPNNGKHIDMFEIMSEQAGFRVSLDKASRLNLNEKKHTSGKSMSELNTEKLKQACQSDVSQTYRLWQKFDKGELKIPTGIRFFFSDDNFGQGHHMPDICPYCHDVGSLELADDIEDCEDMTEGQWADYMAGLF
jgi:hypothetical protein